MISRKVMSKFTFACAALATSLLSQTAHAHFMWSEVSEDNPPVAKISFADHPGTISEGDLVQRVVPAKAWNAKGKELSLTTTGALRTGSLEGSKAFGASLSYGVLDKTEEGRGVFKLMYYTKAAASVKDAGENLKLPLELFAQADGTNAVATLKQGKKALSKLSIHVYEPNEEKPKVLTSDDKGQVRFDASKPGVYGLRALLIEETAGEQDGKKFPATRHWTSLVFRVAGTVAPKVPQTGAASMGEGARPTLPPGPHPKADMAAYELLKNAHDNRQTMPENFAGFTAKVMYKKDGVATSGTITYRRKGKTDIEFPGMSEADFKWAQDKIYNMLGHRRGGSFAEGDGRNPLTFNRLPENSFGKLITLNDDMKSEYRVKDNKVTEVTREAGGMRFTIAVLETIEADNGKYLANHFIVSYRDAKTGDLKMLEGFRDAYSKVDGVWLPLMRYVFTSNAIKPGEADTPTMQIIKFSDIKLLEPVAMAAAPAEVGK